MNQERWSKTDRFLSNLVAPEDSALSEALKASVDAGLPSIQVVPTQGKLLMLLAQSVGARKILEIGTLGGYSTIWLGRALTAGGRLITLEADEKHARVAEANLARAGLGDIVDVRLGRAQDMLPRLIAEGAGPFDFIFIDADKTGYPDYFEWSLALARPGTLIVADNVVRQGQISDPENPDANVRGVRRFLEIAAADRRVDLTVLQTVNAKNYDGMAFLLVK